MNKTTHTMKAAFPILAAILLSAGVGRAQIIYSEGFSSAPTINNTIDNGNTNRGGTGVATDMNQDEWYTRGTRSTITHDTIDGNIDIALNNNNIYFLMDLTDLENDPGGIIEFILSFDVESLGGDINLFAFAGGGLDYSGTGDGHLFFRTYNNPPLFNANNGATKTQIIDGTTTTITNTGTFSTSSFTLNDLDNPGDYVVIGFNGASSLTIDNIALTAVSLPLVTVEVPDAEADEEGTNPGTIRISRGAETSGDLAVLYMLGGTAGTGDYSESYSGTATITDGNSSVDLVFTPVDDSEDEGFETIQIEITADAAYLVGATATGSILITDNETDAIYFNDFSAAQTVNSTIDNGNTNYAGTGAANDLNQEEWYQRGSGGKGSATHDAGDGNVDIVVNSNVYYLIDLSSAAGPAADYTLSFDVVTVSGPVDFFAYAGGGIDYDGTGQGHVFFRTYGTPPSIITGSQGATLSNIVDGATTTITSTGKFTSNSFALSDVGSSGDYVMIGFGGGSGNSLTIDNLAITAVSGGTTTYADWQTVNNTSQTIDQDHDGDGVENGVEYFLGGNSNTTGVTAVPGVTDTGGSLSWTWTKADYPGVYGTDYWIETSPDLADSWTMETDGGNVTISGNDVIFTFPAGLIRFARLVVTGP